MKRVSIQFAELLYLFSFLTFLLGSAITHIEHGTELSLWLMGLAVIITMATTVLPWLGIDWLRLEKKGCRSGWWLALLLQITSWFVFGAAMFFRLGRNLDPFHTLITLVTLLWATWLLIFIYSRHACSATRTDDHFQNKIHPKEPLIQKEEHK